MAIKTIVIANKGETPGFIGRKVVDERGSSAATGNY
jgi:hypothetical protein